MWAESKPDRGALKHCLLLKGSFQGSHHSCAQNKLGDIPDTFSTWHAHSDHCSQHKSDGPWLEKYISYISFISFIVLSWVNSVFWECRDQGKSWGSALPLPVNPYGLADEAADMLGYIFFHTVFMYSLDYWYLVAFSLRCGSPVAARCRLFWEGVRGAAGLGYEWEAWTVKVSPGGRFPCPNFQFPFFACTGEEYYFCGCRVRGTSASHLLSCQTKGRAAFSKVKKMEMFLVLPWKDLG